MFFSLRHEMTLGCLSLFREDWCPNSLPREGCEDEGKGLHPQQKRLPCVEPSWGLLGNNIPLLGVPHHVRFLMCVEGQDVRPWPWRSRSTVEERHRDMSIAFIKYPTENITRSRGCVSYSYNAEGKTGSS